MAEESDLEKTEEPTGRRLEKAREEGQVPHSRELGSFFVLLVAAVAFWVLGRWMLDRLMLLLRKGLQIDYNLGHEPTLALVRLADLSLDALLICAPLLAMLVLVTLLPPFIMNAWIFSIGKLMPDFSRLDPVSGLGRIISWQGVMEMLKAVAKALLVGGVGALVIWREREEIIGLLAEPLHQAANHAGHLISYSFLLVVLTIAVIVAMDVPFQLWQHHDKLKMSREEVKQEMKESEGDPMVKGRIRSLQREAARRRMMSAVPQANVIVTNPTHYAVALSYQSGMAAPKVIAKGMGSIAQKIRQIGAENGVPLLEAPPLARSLYKHTEIDAEIPAGLYEAVASVLAYVYQLSHWKTAGGQYPVPPRDLDVPPELAVVEAA